MMFHFKSAKLSFSETIPGHPLELLNVSLQVSGKY
ncbi:MAG: hypothetical protein RIR11_553, partial [Bacteroidota bacterium]